MNNTTDAGHQPDDLVELGRIVSAYGVLGWVKIQPHSAQAEVLRKAKKWWLSRSEPQGDAGTPVAFSVVKARPQGSSLVAQLAGVDDRDQAEAMRGMVVLAPRSLFPKPEEDEYYWVDLIGCALYGLDDDRTVLIGSVLEVLDNGAHGILRVGLQKDADIEAAAVPDAAATGPVPVLDAKGRQAETLVPFVRAHIQRVDIKARRIDSDWPREL